MARYINPFTDFGFKKLFGEETTKELLISFLNELLTNEQSPIVDITYLNTEQLGEAELNRKSLFDLYCKTETGHYFIVELQRQWQKNFKERLLYYSTFPIQRQSKKGDWNFELKAVYVVAILNFELEESKTNKNKCLSRVKLMDSETKEPFFDKLMYIYIEVPKFKKAENELETQFDKWLFLLRDMERLEKLPTQFKEKIFMKFLEYAELAKLTEEERARYDRSIHAYWDECSIKSSAEERWFRNGLQKGDSKKARKVAINLFQRGFSVQDILEITELSFDELMEIKASL